MTGVGVSWVYKLKKEELVEELIKYHVEESGTVPELRRRFINFIRSTPNLFRDKPKDSENYNEDIDRTMDEEKNANELVYLVRPENASSPLQDNRMQNNASNQANQSNFVMPVADNTVKCLDQMRKWNCHFEGKDVYSFLERIAELRQAYDFSEEQTLKGFPELLRGEALLWYRNEARNLTSWALIEKSIKEYFLSPEEKRRLNHQMRERKQKDNESIRTYVTALATLMRRFGEIDMHEQIDNLYYNMKPELRLYIQRDSITSHVELIQKVERVEETLRIMNKEKKKPEKSMVAAIETQYDSKICCWKCKKRGHTREKCKNKQRKFCSYCGKDNIWTRECSCHPTGNVPPADLGLNEGRS